MSGDIVARLADALGDPIPAQLPLRIILTEDDARELLRLARQADPWHICTNNGPAPLPAPQARPLNTPKDPPF